MRQKKRIKVVLCDRALISRTFTDCILYTHSEDRSGIVYCGQIGLQVIFRAMERPAAEVFVYNITSRK